MRAHRSTLAVYLITFVVLIDQTTKWWVYSNLMITRHTMAVTDFFSIVLVFNKGVTFGLLNELPQKIIPWLLTSAALVILVLLGRWLWRTSSTLVAISLGGIMGGAIGNVIDRLRFGGVVDFLDFHYHEYHWYAFNVADASIVTGVSFLILDSLVRGRRTG